MNEQNISQHDLELIYDLYFDKIYKFFYYKVLSRDIAEDLASETFLTYANILKTDKEIENIRAFLFGVAKNIFLKFLQQKYKQEIPFSNINDNFEEFVGENFEDHVTEYVEGMENEENLEDKVLKFLGQVPEKQRIILRMRLIEKMSLSEICEKLGKDMNYVKTTQKRGLKSLKDIVATNFNFNQSALNSEIQ